MTSRGIGRRLAIASRTVAFLLTSGACLRFSFVAVRMALAHPVDSEEHIEPTDLLTAPKPRDSGKRTIEPPQDEKPLRVTLSVTVSPARSEVFVNRRLLGQTPFVGDVSCKEGRKLRIEVVPRTGRLMRFSRICRGTNIFIRNAEDSDEAADATPLRAPAEE